MYSKMCIWLSVGELDYSHTFRHLVHLEQDQASHSQAA